MKKISVVYMRYPRAKFLNFSKSLHVQIPKIYFLKKDKEDTNMFAREKQIKMKSYAFISTSKLQTAC